VATAALLHEGHHVADARRVEVFGGRFGLRVSEGALVEAVGRLGQALCPAAAGIAEDVRTATVIGADQTSARVDGVRWWEWVLQTVTAAYHTSQCRRNTEVVLTFRDGVPASFKTAPINRSGTPPWLSVGAAESAIKRAGVYGLGCVR
jgi:transposase